MKWFKILSGAVLVLGLNSAMYGPAFATVPGTLDLVSSDSGGSLANGDSFDPALSKDGRYIAFESTASNLVSGDTNNKTDVFVKDRNTGAIDRVSISSGGTQANGGSSGPSISTDGRYIVFDSDANNLIASDTNSTNDVFMHDRQTGETTLISQSSGGTQANGYSDLSPNTAISADGRFIVFPSFATNLVSGDTNGNEDLFVRDTIANTTKRVNVADDGTEGNGYTYNGSISGDGRYIAYGSSSTNLVASDSNGKTDTFVLDRVAGVTKDITITGNNQSDGSVMLSADGTSVLFASVATNLVAGDTNGFQDSFVYNQKTNTITRATLTNSGAELNSDPTSNMSISGDGRYVTFITNATNVTSNDTDSTYDVFLRDVTGGTTQLLSVNSSPAKGNNNTWHASISPDGTVAAYATNASNLVPSDTNNKSDIIAADTGNSAVTYCAQ